MKIDSSEERVVFSNATNLSEAAKMVIDFSKATKVWLFEGQMGAGKTTLIKEICTLFHCVDNVTSPTFSLVNEYENTDCERFYHFDFYRIKTEEEAADIGIDEYFYSGNYCFVEWPSKIPSLLPDDYVTIHIDVVSETERKITMVKKCQQLSKL